MSHVEKRRLVHLLLILPILVLILPIPFHPPALASMPLEYPPIRSVDDQPMFFPVMEDPFMGKDDILVDNFEYWDSPLNHGWRGPLYEVVYEIFGYYYSGPFETALDLQARSRVLDLGSVPESTLAIYGSTRSTL